MRTAAQRSSQTMGTRPSAIPRRSAPRRPHEQRNARAPLRRAAVFPGGERRGKALLSAEGVLLTLLQKKPEVTAMSPLPARETPCVSLSPVTARTAACPGCDSLRGSAQGAAVPPPPFGLLCRRVFLTFLLPISWDIGTGHAWKTRLAVRGLRLSRPAKNAGRSQTQPRQNSPSARAKIGAA